MILFLMCLSCDDNTGPSVSGDTPEPSVLSLGIASWSYAKVEWNFTSEPDDDFGSYRLYKSDTPGISGDSSSAEMIYTTLKKHLCYHIDSTVVPTDEYFYALLTTNAEGYSAWSNEIAVDIPDSEPDSVTSVITVGEWPCGICCLPSGEYVYVCCYGAEEVLVIRTADDIVVATIDLGHKPISICALPSGEYVYVTHDEGVSAIRTSDNTIAATVPMQLLDCSDICALPSGEYVYVSSSALGYVVVIKTSDNTLAGTIQTGGYPMGICSTPSGEYVYVADYETNTIIVIRTSDNTIQNSIGISYLISTRLCVLPSGDYVYVISHMQHMVSVIETAGNTVVESIEVEPSPKYICAHSSGEYVYITHGNSKEISVIRTSDNQIVEYFPVGHNNPYNICTLPSGEAFYIVNVLSDKITVIR